MWEEMRKIKRKTRKSWQSYSWRRMRWPFKINTRAHIFSRLSRIIFVEKNHNIWKKFGLSIKNLNNLWSFIKVYAVFVPNLCGEKSARRKSVWRKNDKYEVWDRRNVIARPFPIPENLDRKWTSHCLVKFPSLFVSTSLFIENGAPMILQILP